MSGSVFVSARFTNKLTSFFCSQENPADPTEDPPGGGWKLQGGTLVHLVEETTSDGGLLRAADDTGSNRAGQLPRVIVVQQV